MGPKPGSRQSPAHVAKRIKSLVRTRTKLNRMLKRMIENAKNTEGSHVGHEQEKR